MSECIVFFGPSGVGKSTLIKMLMEKYHESYEFATSHTTRPIRPGELDGKEYHFITKSEFIKKIEGNDFIEWSNFCDNYYGTSKDAVNSIISNKHTCILDLDLNGIKSMKNVKEFKSTFVFIKPKSIDDISVRLTKRGTNDKLKEKRIMQAKHDLEKVNDTDFDIIIVNDNLELAFLELIKKLIQ